MVRLHRHQLARLTTVAWCRLFSAARDDVERDSFAMWAERGWPVVVTQQPCGASGDPAWIAMGLAAPTRWERRRIALQVAREEVLFFDEFPAATLLTAQLPTRQRASWATLCGAWRATGAMPRVYGSHGWQLLTGMAYVRGGSDIDLWTPVDGVAQADAVAATLAGADLTGHRLDGELLFRGDRAVSWREWMLWRTGRSRALLVKSLGGTEMVRTIEALVGGSQLEAVS